MNHNSSTVIKEMISVSFVVEVLYRLEEIIFEDLLENSFTEVEPLNW